MSLKGRFLRIFTVVITIMVIFVAVTAVVLPLVIKSKALKKRIEAMVQARTGVHVVLGATEISLFPGPCVKFRQVLLEREGLSFKARDVRLYPDLLVLIGRDHDDVLPIRSISFEEGLLLRGISLNNGKILFSGRLIRFSARGSIGNECDFSLAGSYHSLKKYAAIEVAGGRTEIGDLMETFFNDHRLRGVVATAFNFNMDAVLDGNGPYELKLKRLKLDHPELTARGVLKVRKEADDLHLDLDISMEAVDVNGIRPLLRQIFPDEKAIKQTVEIVRGGRLDAFRLQFKGMKKDLKHFENYKISATGRDCPIYIPKIDLLIHKVNGSIEIKKAVLTAKGLAARLRSTTGENCSIRLDLGGQHKKIAFKGELAATSDDILWAVKKFVKDENVSRWAGDITSTSGTARGRLEIQGPLKHVSVAIKARPQDVKVKTKGVPDEIRVSGGTFSLFTKTRQIVLRSVAGGYGDITWNGMDARMRWGKARTFDVTVKGVKLDINALQRLLNRTQLADNMKKSIRSASGTLVVERARFKGGMKRPWSTSYEITLGGGKGLVDSPLLPAKVSFKGPSGTITNGSLQLRSINLYFSDNTTLDVRSFRLSHTKGGIKLLDASLTGRIGEIVGGWVMEKTRIPGEFTPGLPLDVKSLRISLERPGDWAISGTLGRTDKMGHEVTCSISMKKEPALTLIKGLTINGPDSNARIRFAVKKASHARLGSLRFSYNGSLKSHDLNVLLKENRLLFGELDGDLSLSIGNLEHPHIKGTLVARGIKWPWGVQRPVFIDDLNTSTQGSHMEITRLRIREGESEIQGHGALFGSARGLIIAFEATDGTINLDSLVSLLTKEDKTHDKAASGRPGQRLKWPRLIRTVKGNFHLKEVHYKRKVIQSASGTFLLGEDRDLSLDLHSSILCGIHLALNLYHKGEKPDVTLRLWTEDQEAQTPDFHMTLPCLGVTNDIIRGPIMLDANLHGTPGDWEKGSFKLKAGPGVVKRSSVIAKIFAIINVTGLFKKGLFKSDLPYSVLDVTGAVQGEKMVIERLILKAEGLDFFGRGEALLDKGTLDLFVLVSPLKTFDYLLSKIPVLGYAIGGKNRTILTIPVKVSGPFRDPTVSVLDPEAIGKGVLDLFKNIITIPVRIVVPQDLEGLETKK